MDPYWAIGVILVLIGSIANNLGNNLMNLGNYEEDETTTVSLNKGQDLESNNNKPTEEPKKQSWIYVGTFIFVSGALLTFVAYGFASQSLLASLESIQFVSNVFFVSIVHGEQITIRMVLSTLSIVIGNILVIIFSDHKKVLFDSNQILNLYGTNQAYWGYVIIGSIIMLGSFFVYSKYYHSRVVLKAKPLWNHNLIEPLSFAISSTIIGTQAVLQAKCLSMLLNITIGGGNHDNQLRFAAFWLILIAWILFVSFWFSRLYFGLTIYLPLFIVPLLQVFFMLFAILSGGIFFEEFNTFSPSQFGGFIVGILLILLGVYGLAPPEVDLEEEEEKEGGDVDDGVSQDGVEMGNFNVQNDPEFEEYYKKYLEEHGQAMSASLDLNSEDEDDRDTISQVKKALYEERRLSASIPDRSSLNLTSFPSPLPPPPTPPPPSTPTTPPSPSSTASKRASSTQPRRRSSVKALGEEDPHWGEGRLSMRVSYQGTKRNSLSSLQTPQFMPKPAGLALFQDLLAATASGVEGLMSSAAAAVSSPPTLDKEEKEAGWGVGEIEGGG